MSRWEFKSDTSMLESARFEVLKGNKVVMYEENGKFVLIIWERYVPDEKELHKKLNKRWS